MSVIETATALVASKPTLDAIMVQLVDRSIPLDERWEAYRILCVGGIITNVEGAGSGHVRILKDANGRADVVSLYDDFYIDRHQTGYYHEMYENILEEGHPAYECEFDPDSINEWRETILMTGDVGFEYDW